MCETFGGEKAGTNAAQLRVESSDAGGSGWEPLELAHNLVRPIMKEALAVNSDEELVAPGRWNRLTMMMMMAEESCVHTHPGLSELRKLPMAAGSSDFKMNR